MTDDATHVGWERFAHLEHPQRAATAGGVLQIHQAHVDGRERVVRALVLHHEMVRAELALSMRV